MNKENHLNKVWWHKKHLYNPHITSTNNNIEGMLNNPDMSSTIINSLSGNISQYSGQLELFISIGITALPSMNRDYNCYVYSSCAIGINEK